ncbi:hypothetical protein L6164_017580 [Bauhinia variegata]|uniref:Uncharacterized protein n=1 Tax=Bauhinia variegata TaxID=167791 RepID=A0ACB9N8J9_BAUVA|nr:hypothetical protein L6164_017580 [Bauhinia variegata]
MASKNLLTWEVLFLFVLLLSAKAIARNHAATSELYTSLEGQGRRLAGQPPCRKLRAALGTDKTAYDIPRCHNYR